MVGWGNSRLPRDDVTSWVFSQPVGDREACNATSRDDEIIRGVGDLPARDYGGREWNGTARSIACEGCQPGKQQPSAAM